MLHSHVTISRVSVPLRTLIVLVVCACGGSDGGSPTFTPPLSTPVVRAVSVSPATGTVSPGQALTLAATVQADAGASQSLTWASENAAVATVSGSGVVTGVAPGVVRVTASSVATPSVSGGATITVTAATYRLTVTRLEGVTGSPADGTTNVAAGATVTYAFTSDSSHERLQVLIDSLPAPNSGSFVMTGKRTLTAMTDRKIVVPAAVQAALAETATALKGMLGTRPMIGYRAMVSAVSALASNASPDSLARYLRVARLQAFAGVDALAIAKSIKEINDSLALRPASTVPLRASARIDGTGGITFLYINGINTAARDAEMTANQFLSKVTAAAGFTDPLLYPIDHLYNATGNSSDVNEIAAQVCVQRRADAAAEGLLTDPDPDCEQRLMKAAGTSDLLEAYLQVMVHSLKRLPVSGTGKALADRIAQQLLTRRVVVVAHSQGNLFVNEAYRALEGITGVNNTCVGTVSLAPPLPIQPLAGGHAVSSSIAAGLYIKDMLLQAEDLAPGTLPGIRTVPVSRNELTTMLDQRYMVLNNAFLNFLSLGSLAALRARLWYSGGLTLHSIEEDYLGANRAATIQALKDQAQNVFTKCVSRLDVSGTGDGAPNAALPAITVRLLAPGDELGAQVNTPVVATLSATTPGAALSGTTTVSPISGIAKFDNLRVDRAATGVRLTFTAGRVSIQSTAFSVGSSSGPATKLAFSVQPAAVSTGAVIIPAVQIAVQNGTGATVTTAANTVTLALSPSAGVTLGGTLTRAAVNGIATFDNLTISAPGTHTLSAASAGLTGVTSQSFAVSTPTGPAGLGIGFGAEQFALIPAGTFQMGDGSTYTAKHQVTLTRPFLMQRTEVTQAQWRQVTGASPSYFTSCGNTCPVEMVSWNDVQRFLTTLNVLDPGKNYRLPTEAEWEYSARAGTSGLYGVPGAVTDIGWFLENAGNRPRTVAQKTCNAWRLCDMHGNISEWVYDSFEPYPDSSVTDPKGPTPHTIKTLRGGSFNDNFDIATSFKRFLFGDIGLGPNIGFRLVRNP